MYGRLVQNDDVLAEIDAEVGVLAKESFAEFSCLTHEVAPVFGELFIFPRVVAHQDETDIVRLPEGVEYSIVHNGRLYRIVGSAVRRRRFCLQCGKPAVISAGRFKPSIAVFAEFCSESGERPPLSTRHKRNIAVSLLLGNVAGLYKYAKLLYYYRKAASVMIKGDA